MTIYSLKGMWTESQRSSGYQLKTPQKASNSYDEKLHSGRFYHWRERDYVIYVHIDVNLDGWKCCLTFSSWKIKWWRSCFKSRPPALLYHISTFIFVHILLSQRLQIGLYSIFTREWLRRYPRDQFMFLNLDDWHSRCEHILPNIFEFLETG